MFRRITLAMAALFLSTVLIGCHSGGQSNGDAPSELHVGYTTELDGLNPATTDGAATSMVLLYNVYETLVRATDSGEIAPLLASSWDVSHDNKTYTFHLHDNATFSNGDPIDATAVVSSLEYSLGKTGAQIRPLIIKQLSAIESVKATGDRDVTITLNRPSNNWLYSMTGPAGIIYNPKQLSTLDTATAGSGPFELEKWDVGSTLTLKANVNFWGSTRGVSTVIFHRYADANAMTSAMLSGQLDVISNLTTPEALSQFNDPSRFTVLNGNSNGEVVLGYNHTTKALQDRRVRQAITHAIDRKGLVDSVWGGQGKLIGSMVPPQDPWYVDLAQKYPYDPTQAKRLLKEAGFDTGLALRLRVPALPYAAAGGRYVASQLEHIGIKVSLEELEFAVWLDEVYRKANYDLTIVAHVEPRDLEAFANPKYYWRYDNPEFQKLLAQADAGSVEEQKTLLSKASEVLADDAAATWLFLLPNLIVTTTQVKGISANSTNLSFDLTKVQLEKS